MANLASTDLKTIMRTAWTHHIPVPAFNVPYLPVLAPIVDTLKRLDAFALTEVSRLEIVKFKAESWARVAGEFNRCADRAFTRLHQDHVPVIDEDNLRVDWETQIRQALDLGYDSVMIDGSRLPFDENARVARTVAELAHAKNVPAEAELGAVLGHESGPLPPYDELFTTGRGFTRIEEAQRFVRETGIDWLSVAIGNIHGAIFGAAKDQKKVEARLNIEHLRKLADATGVPLVLHGGSGVKHQAVLDAIGSGITKINVGTTLRQAYDRVFKETGAVDRAQAAVADEVENLVVNYFRIKGSASRLAERMGS